MAETLTELLAPGKATARNEILALSERPN